MALTRLLARPLLSSIFFVGAYSALRNSEKVAVRARKVTDKVVPRAQERGVPLPSNPATLVKINAATQIVAAAGLATGRAPRVCAGVLAVTLVPTTVAGHSFWDEQDPATKSQQKLQFAKNLSVLGGLLLAMFDTEGQPGVAWRARHAAKGARRQAKQIAKDAKLEARLAAKSIG